jgi:hypothetical protein
MPNSINSTCHLETKVTSKPEELLGRVEEMHQGGVNFAIIGTGAYATNLQQTVLDSTCVADVEQDIREPTAHWRRQLNDTIVEGQRFWRRMVWGDDAKSVSGTVLWTESAEPLPCPPQSEFENVEVLSTIAKYSQLFKVSTPINIDRFETILTHAQHPNLPFVCSVCQGLCEGFWPWVDMHVGVYLTTWEIPSPTPSTSQE